MADDGYSGLGRFVLSPQLRATLLFVAGLGLTIRESLTNGVDRPSLYVLWGGMMGLSVLQGKSGKKGAAGKGDDD